MNIDLYLPNKDFERAKMTSSFLLPPFLDGFTNPTVTSKGRQVTFTKTLENKGFRTKSLKNF